MRLEGMQEDRFDCKVFRIAAKPPSWSWDYSWGQLLKDLGTIYVCKEMQVNLYLVV